MTEPRSARSAEGIDMTARACARWGAFPAASVPTAPARAREADWTIPLGGPLRAFLARQRPSELAEGRCRPPVRFSRRAPLARPYSVRQPVDEPCGVSPLFHPSPRWSTLPALRSRVARSPSRMRRMDSSAHARRAEATGGGGTRSAPARWSRCRTITPPCRAVNARPARVRGFAARPTSWAGGTSPRSAAHLGSNAVAVSGYVPVAPSRLRARGEGQGCSRSDGVSLRCVPRD